MKGRRLRLFYLLLILMIGLPFSAFARDFSPVVPTDWLEKNLNSPKLITVDIRKVEEYKEGHIPNSINVFYGTWAIKKKGLDSELPEEDDLFDIIGSAGIQADSHVVVIGKTDTATELTNITRVAWTLLYGGIENVAILDGGFNKWKGDKKSISTEILKQKAGEYKGRANKALNVTKEYLLGKIGQYTLVDTRMPDFFFGILKLGSVEKAGHIQGAVNLPSPWMFTNDGTVKNKEELEAIVSGVIGKDMSKEIITYCDTGKHCSGWWFVLREVLAYKDVKSYDGSMQEWAKDPNAPVIKYSWH